MTARAPLRRRASSYSSRRECGRRSARARRAAMTRRRLVVGLGDVGLELSLERARCRRRSPGLQPSSCPARRARPRRVLRPPPGRLRAWTRRRSICAISCSMAEMSRRGTWLLSMRLCWRLRRSLTFADLVFDAGHLAARVRDDGVLADRGALQVSDAARELAHGRVRGVRVALVAQRRFLLVKLLELEKLELVGVRSLSR